MLEKGDIKQRGLFSEPPSSRFSDLTIKYNIAENKSKSKSYPQILYVTKKPAFLSVFLWVILLK